MTSAFQYREDCYRKWRKAYEFYKIRYWIEHQQARATLRRLISQRLKRFDASAASNEDGRVKPIFTTPSGPQDASNTMAQRLQHTFNGDIRSDSPPPPIVLPSLAPFVNDPPFTIDSINTVMNILLFRKAPGVDHLRFETLRPL
ncbi:MAG: hypothetical protein EXX96DRAFT_623439 [Benjaminiella poitrasii]|nr:MAG: hypothetical protein EXX96DRAFT_623439 [Benjaminiella poitrasii]